MDLGFVESGFSPILAVDVCPAAGQSYRHNADSDVVRESDLACLTGTDVIALLAQVSPGRQPRGVIGGPPCQGFSRGNRTPRYQDPRNRLPFTYAEILADLNAVYNLDFFVFENVPGLLSNKHARRYARIKTSLRKAGFNLFQATINALNFGVPQNRKRLFLVGINRNTFPSIQFSFPEGGTIKRTVKDAIFHLSPPAFWSRNLARADIPVHPNHWAMNPKSKKFTEGTSESGRSFRRLSWDQPSPTVAYGHREVHVHPTGRRRLSVYEAMLLQGFPSTYELCGTLSDQFEQVSNAVPPPVAHAVATAIRCTLYGHLAGETLSHHKGDSDG